MEINSDRQKNRKEMKIENEKMEENKYLRKQIQEIRSSRLISVPACLMQQRLDSWIGSEELGTFYSICQRHLLVKLSTVSFAHKTDACACMK